MNIQKEQRKSKAAPILKRSLAALLVAVGIAGSLMVGHFFDARKAVLPAQESSVASASAGGGQSFSVKVSSSTHTKGPAKAKNTLKTAVNTGADPAVLSATSSKNGFIASKNGHTFYAVSCPQVKKIKKENQISFLSAAAAEGAGYLPSRQCKAMKNP